MSSRIKPQIILDVGFDFSWDEQKVWALDVEPEDMDIEKLSWHFDIPFIWSKPDGYYDTRPQEVINSPALHEAEYIRTMKSDLKYPIDIMKWRGRWLILDGLHRLMKASIQGQATVRVRKISQEYIDQIKKP